ncbi:MAG: hypothetical protein JWM28_4542 [Chitinophagaceae bacterium]|nr:hypothetical protein [Chitinophagaceae bacterium]
MDIDAKNISMRNHSRMKILDAILEYLEPNDEPEEISKITEGIRHFLPDHNNITVNLTRRALHKLTNDGYVLQRPPIMPDGVRATENIDNLYVLSFDGGFFFQDGGYISEKKRKIQKKISLLTLQEKQRIQKEESHDLSKQMSKLTLLLVIGTFIAGLYYVVSLVLTIHEALHPISKTGCH